MNAESPEEHPSQLAWSNPTATVPPHLALHALSGGIGREEAARLERLKLEVYQAPNLSSFRLVWSR